MSSELHKRLQSLRSTERRIKPDAVWIRATRATLLMQVGNTLPTKRVSIVEGTQQVVRHFFIANLSGVLRKPVMAFVSLLAVVAGGSFMSVSAAERSLPGDFFYGLKLATEQAQLAMTSSKDEKLKLKTEFTTRRVGELKKVAADSKTDGTNNGARIKQVAEILKSDLNTLKQQLSDVKQDGSSESVVAAAKLVDQKTNEVITALQESKADVSPDAKAAVTDAQSAAADASVNAIEVLVEKHQESNDVVPVQDVTDAIQNHANAVANATQDSQMPLELQGVTSTLLMSTSTTVASFVQTLSTSTVETVSSTAALPGIVDQVKDLTTQAFTLQKEKDQKDAQQAADGGTQTGSASSTSLVPTDTSTTSTSSSPPVQ